LSNLYGTSTLVCGWSESGSTNVDFETGRVSGGNSHYVFLGTWRVWGHGALSVTHRAGEKHRIFGPANSLTLNVTGRLTTPTAQLHGDVAGHPGVTVLLHLRKFMEPLQD
jgi:hypothetical protein